MSVNNHRKCAKCGKTRADDMSVTYHRFPNPGTVNITKARALATYCWPNKDRTSIQSLRSLYNSNKVLCGRHFNSSQFYDGKRQKLSRFAVPESILVDEIISQNENVFKQILTKCFNSNMNAVATVCDLSTVNIKVLKTLGVTISEPFFIHCGREIVAVLDPPHLLKCNRNQLMKHNVEYTSCDVQCNDQNIKGKAKWSDIESFYKLDKNNVNFVYAPALTDNHIKPNLKQQMRVKLAAQVFSHSVTAGILAKIASNELPAEAQATASFTQKFDELFDAVNADSPDLRRGKKYSTNITTRSPHLSLFREMRKFISSMKYIGSKTKPPSQGGWIQTINAIDLFN